MKKFSRLFSFTILMMVVLVNFNCQQEKPVFEYKHWTVSEPVFTPGPEGTFDDAAVKDPTIVFYNGKYHLIYTSKAKEETFKNLEYVSKGRSGAGYAAATTLEGLNSAERYDLCSIVKDVIVAPQVFYFEPHELWYIIAQTPQEGEPNLAPIYLTNPNIEDPYGWSKPEIIETQKTNDDFWIDFWVICDDEKAHLFYTDHKGSMFRMETPIDEFPHGYADEREETVLADRGETEIGRWRLHEASHIYYVKKTGKYLALLEAVYPHPTRPYYWESRNRFMFAMIADKLEGPWFRVEADHEEFAGDPRYLFNEDGSPSKYGQVSHFELIRSGYNEKMEIDDYNLTLLFQAFDPTDIPDNYNYDELPWELAVMKNY
ncbi:hypothetical protein GF337_09345 [candidate division KSB1 bacterium]|nr:hypothetical protein [candidate division KSB1 bacterium]